MYNLRNRSFLKEIDFTTEEMEYLLTLSAALKAAKYAGTEVPRLQGKEIALIFEKTSTRTRSAFEVAAFDQGAHVTYLDPSGSQMGHKESIADTARVLGRMYDAIEYRGAAHSDGRGARRARRRAGLQRAHRRVAPDADAGRLPHDGRGRATSPTTTITYCYMGDARSNMGRSLLVMGAIMGSDVRICAPRSCGRPSRCCELARERADQSGARITLTDDARRGAARRRLRRTPTSGSRWASPRRCGTSASKLLTPYQVNRAALEKTGNPQVRSSCTACRPSTTTSTVVGREIMEHTGTRGRARGHRRGLRVARAASSSIRPRTGCTRSRPCSSRRSGLPRSPSTSTGCRSARAGTSCGSTVASTRRWRPGSQRRPARDLYHSALQVELPGASGS